MKFEIFWMIMDNIVLSDAKHFHESFERRETGIIKQRSEKFL